MGDSLGDDEMNNLWKEATNNELIVVKDEVSFLSYENFAKFLKGLWTPPPKEDPKKKKK